MDNIINPNKIDMTKERTKQQWTDLLTAVKDNFQGTLTKDEQDYYMTQIEFKITGKHPKFDDILKAIKEGAADIDDIG